MTRRPAGRHSEGVWKRTMSLRDSGGLHPGQTRVQQRLWDVVDVGSPSSHQVTDMLYGGWSTRPGEADQPARAR